MAEGGGLLNRYTVNSRIVGSNPIPSATSVFLVFPGCFTPVGKARDSASILLPLVSRRILLSHNRWGNKMGNGMDVPTPWREIGWRGRANFRL